MAENQINKSDDIIKELLDALETCSDQIYGEWGEDHRDGPKWINDLLAKYGREKWWEKKSNG